MRDVNELLIYAESEVNCLQSGEIFLVKDLFKGYEWKRIPKKDRILLGSLFLNSMKNKSECKIIGKTSSNQQRYERI